MTATDWDVFVEGRMLVWSGWIECTRLLCGCVLVMKNYYCDKLFGWT